MASRQRMSDADAARADAEMKSDTAERAGDSLRVRREPLDPTMRRASMSMRSSEATMRAAPPVPPQPQPDTMIRERIIRRPIIVRGGIAPGAILTGVLVSLGAMVVFMAIAAGALAAAGVIGSGTANTPSIVRATVLTGVGMVFAQFLAYLWGGYTAGRMARGAGALNGFMVPLFAIIIGAGVGVLVGWLGTKVSLNYSFQTTRFPIDRDLKLHLGYAIGAASIFAMFVGGIVGGVRGVWWHRKLEGPAVMDEMEVER
jgi:hypothetical protein